MEYDNSKLFQILNFPEDIFFNVNIFLIVNYNFYKAWFYWHLCHDINVFYTARF